MTRHLTLLLLFSLSCNVGQAATPWDWCRWALGRWASNSAHQGQKTPSSEAPQTSHARNSFVASEVQFDDLAGRLDFLLGVLRQHPNLVTSNLSFRRNLLETLSHVSRVQKLLGAEAALMEAKMKKAKIP